MASPKDKTTEGTTEKTKDDTTQNDSANVLVTPRMHTFADDVAETVLARRKRDKMEDQDILLTAAGETIEDNVGFLENWKPPQGIIRKNDLDAIFEKIEDVIGTNDLRIHDKRLNSLRNLKPRREIILRENIKRIDLTRKYKLKAAYVYITGKINAEICKQCLAGNGPFKFCVANFGKCANCLYTSQTFLCSLDRNRRRKKEDDSGGSEDDQAEEEEINGVKKPPPVEPGAASKPSRLAAKGSSGLDAVPEPNVQPEAGVGEGHPQDPEPAKVYEVGGRQLRARARQPIPRYVKPTQKQQNITGPNHAPVGPKQQEQAMPGSSIVNTNLTDKTNTATNTRSAPDQLDRFLTGPGIDTPKSPPTTTDTQTTQAPADPKQRAQTQSRSSITNTNLIDKTDPVPDQPDHLPTRPGITAPSSLPTMTAIPTTQAPAVNGPLAGLREIMKRHLEKYDLTKSGPNRQQQVGNHTSGPSKNTETGGNGADRNSYNHGTSQQRERDDRTRRSSWSTRDRNQDTWTDTNGERRDHRINRRERTPTAAARSRSDSPKLSNSPDTSGVSTSTNSPSNTTILACLPPNTPVEVLRCLERYHQNIADDLRLERRSMSRNRTTRSLYDPDGADKRDNDDQGHRGRSDAGPCSSILDCLNSTGSHLDMMRQLGLHYQFQADELRLECLRIEKEERRRERRARRHRERD